MGDVRSRWRPWAGVLVSVGLAALASCGRTSQKAGQSAPAQAGAGADAGAGAPNQVTQPDPLPDGPQCATTVAGIDGRHCAVYRDGSVWCFGGSFGRAPSNFQSSTEPVQVADAYGERIALGPRHSCLVTGRGEIFCWGDNEAGQIDDSGQSPLGPTRVELLPPGMLGVKGLGLSDTQTCVVDRFSHVYCRGIDGDGKRSSSFPVDVAGAADTTMPGSGNDVIDERGRVFSLASWQQPELLSHIGWDNLRVSQGGPTCVVKRWGTLWCTDYRIDVTSLPLRVVAAPKHDFVDVGVGDLFMCALDVQGGVWCEGFNQQGQTASGTNSTFEAGHPVEGLGKVRALSVNHSSACAVSDDGKLWCWGAIGPGRLVNVPTLMSSCDVEGYTPPPVNAPPTQRRSAEELSEAAFAYAETYCSCSGSPLDQEACVERESDMPNGACLAALAPEDPYRYGCKADELWEIATCYTTAACQEIDCWQPSECGQAKAPELEQYCRRRSCADNPRQQLLRAQVCDGLAQCEDSSDERNCTPNRQVFECGDRTIPTSQVCDHEPDCADGSDETFCP